MPRYCFSLQVHRDLLGEYTRRHAHVWPEMLEALANSGWHNYSLFARPDGLVIGYVEADDLVAAQAAIEATEVNVRWQTDMARFFVSLDGRRPDDGLQLLPEIFHLGDQLARSSSSAAGAV